MLQKSFILKKHKRLKDESIFCTKQAPCYRIYVWLEEQKNTNKQARQEVQK